MGKMNEPPEGFFEALFGVDGELLTVPEMAKAFKLSEGHVRDRLVKREGFPAPYMIGGSPRYPKPLVIEWVKSNRLRKSKGGRPRKVAA